MTLESSDVLVIASIKNVWITLIRSFKPLLEQLFQLCLLLIYLLRFLISLSNVVSKVINVIKLSLSVIIRIVSFSCIYLFIISLRSFWHDVILYPFVCWLCGPRDCFNSFLSPLNHPLLQSRSLSITVSEINYVLVLVSMSLLLKRYLAINDWGIIIICKSFYHLG